MYGNQTAGAGSLAAVAAVSSRESILPGPPPNPSALREVQGRIDYASERIWQITNRVNGIADRTFGAVPACANTSAAKTPDSPGTLGLIHERLNALVSAIDSLDSEAMRLDGI